MSGLLAADPGAWAQAINRMGYHGVHCRGSPCDLPFKVRHLRHTKATY